jgi:hypothetical protein
MELIDLTKEVDNNSNCPICKSKLFYTFVERDNPAGDCIYEYTIVECSNSNCNYQKEELTQVYCSPSWCIE